MHCLDTYALVEIRLGNKDFSWLLNEKFFISELTLCEFFGVLYKENGEIEAQKWFKKLEPFSIQSDIKILIEAIKFKITHNKRNISFFDAVGYITSISNNAKFVTGDKEFKEFPNVKFIK